MKHFEYLEPGTVAEACGLLKQYGGNARVFAGGSSLTILLKQSLLQPDALINIRRSTNYAASMSRATTWSSARW